jgi:hypothetical protein
MNFVEGLPRAQSGYNSLWIIVDRLTKVAHFVPANMTYTGPHLAEMYSSMIVCFVEYP